jgi:hypothetical protein
MRKPAENAAHRREASLGDKNAIYGWKQADKGRKASSEIGIPNNY